MILEKHRVCKDCLSIGIKSVDCVCVYAREYELITLEFERCECCGQLSDEYADTEFNKKQLETLQNG